MDKPERLGSRSKRQSNQWNAIRSFDGQLARRCKNLMDPRDQSTDLMLKLDAGIDALALGKC